MVASFNSHDLKRGKDGWCYVQFQMRLTSDAYFRLRGTNMPRNTPGQTDAAGNPLLDPQDNTAQKAYQDLWFYSNPIFVRVR